MSLPVIFFYIDSRFKTIDSVSSSNFKIDLNQTLLFPPNAVFYIDDISIPHSWYTVEENMNDKLYIYLSPKEVNQDNDGVIYKIIKIESGNYTGADLATELNLKINEQLTIAGKPNVFQCYFNAKKKPYQYQQYIMKSHFKY